MKRIKIIQSVIGLALIFLIKDLFSQGIEVTVTPTNQDIANYQTVNFYISVMPSGGFDEQVFFSVVSTNLPAGYSAIFCPMSISYPYTGGDTLKVTLDNVHPMTADCYIIFQTGNGPVQVQDTVFLRLVGSFCDWVYQTSTPDDFTRITIDANDVKWMYGPSWAGLLKYDGTTQTRYMTSNSNIPSNDVTDLAVNKITNELWMTTHAGLAKFDGTYWTIYTKENSSIPTNNLHSLAVDGNGIIWIGAGAQSTSYRGGVIKFDGTNWQFFDHSNSTIYDGETALVRIDNLNNIWVVSDTADNYGYYASNLSKFNGTSWAEYFSSNSCFQLHHDVHDIDFDSENVLWIAAGNESGSIIPMLNENAK